MQRLASDSMTSFCYCTTYMYTTHGLWDTDLIIPLLEKVSQLHQLCIRSHLLLLLNASLLLFSALFRGVLTTGWGLRRRAEQEEKEGEVLVVDISIDLSLSGIFYSSFDSSISTYGK